MRSTFNRPNSDMGERITHRAEFLDMLASNTSNMPQEMTQAPSRAELVDACAVRGLSHTVAANAIRRTGES